MPITCLVDYFNTKIAVDLAWSGLIYICSTINMKMIYLIQLQVPSGEFAIKVSYFWSSLNDIISKLTSNCTSVRSNSARIYIF